MSSQSLKQFWEDLDDVEVQKLPMGETGLTAGQALNARRLEAIAEWFAIPDEKKDPRDILGLARALGVSPASIRKWQRDPRMLRRVREKTIEFGTYMMPNVLWNQYKQAVLLGDGNAAKFVRDTVGMGPAGGGGREVNVTTNVNVSTHNEEDEYVLEEMNRLVERRARARSRVVSDVGDSQSVQGDQGSPSVEALLPDPGDRDIPQEYVPDTGTTGTEPRG